jgi:murein DD-endopeptidase MepM/ murein hydrolase activator NlpD
MRRLLAVILVVGALTPFAPFANAPVSADDAAEQAAKEIADARERANAAADAYFEAESRIDSLSLEAQALQEEIVELQAQVDELTERVQQIAVNRFTRSGASASPLLNGFASPEERMQLAAMSAIINDTSDADFDEYDSVNRELADKQDELENKQQQAADEKANAEQLRIAAEEEVQRLKEVEAERLHDEAVRQALEAEERARAAREAEEAAALAEATVDTVLGNDADGGGGAPQTTLPVSGVGGQTGGGGSGGRPGGAGGSDYGGPGWVCPTGLVPVAFGDTWGAPRSGGRQHQGVDMIGTRGTPILAVVDGFAQPKSNTLGGTTISFIGSDGNRYYYAHLDSYGKLGPVSAGDVIGFMGDTGNARFSVVHLHFEIHPAGGAAVNPYPTVRAHC